MASELSNAEWKIMDVVWRRDETTVRDVFEYLEPETGWAYTTCKTMLARLVEKNVLAVRREGKTSVFRPLLQRGDARRSALDGLIERAFGGGLSPFMHFLVNESSMSAADHEALKKLLKDGIPSDAEREDDDA